MSNPSNADEPSPRPNTADEALTISELEAYNLQLEKKLRETTESLAITE